jgi:chemotaxis protein MotB
MRKQKRLAKKIWHEEDNSERWVISYADFITLLFAFFVTLYATSSVNQGRYNVVADSLGLAFLDTPPLSYPVRASQVAIQEPINSTEPNGKTGFGALTPHFLTRPTYFEMTPDIRDELGQMASNGLMQVEETKQWLEISLNTKVLFSSGSATLLPEAATILKPLVHIFKKLSAPIQVEGFTDSVPIYNELFPSNWELSSARAAAVVRQLVELKLPSRQFVVVGYGANFPIASNKTLVGREINRRVVMVIAKSQRVQRLVKNTFVERKKPLTQAEKRKQLIDNQPRSLEKFRTPDGRVRYTTLPERKSKKNRVETE